MKKLISFFILTLLGFTAYCQGGVDFEDITYEEALAKAKAENKLVLMDCYTSWCAPCKKMTNNVFPQKEAGEFFNPRFVCVKFDMEKGVGKELTKKFNVKAFPTFLIIRPDGTVQHKIVSAGALKEFISWVELGLNKKTSLEYLNKRYATGKMNKKELLVYENALNFANEREKNQQIRKEIASKLTDKDRLKSEYWFIMQEQPYGSYDFNFIITHLPTLRENIDPKKVDRHLYSIYNNTLNDCIKDKGLMTSNEIKNQVEKISTELSGIEMKEKEKITRKLELVQACINKKPEQIASLVEQMKPTAQSNEAWVIVPALCSVEEYATREELQRIVAIGDKLTDRLSPGEMRENIEKALKSLKMAAHVGVYFQDLTYAQALEKAKQENKMIFLDGYTSWCGPCKMMTNKIFTQEKVGDYFNEKFICVKYDMEKGEGAELAKKFEIRYFPTFMIIKPDGVVRHKVVGGSRSGTEFIERVEETFDDSKALEPMQAKFNSGNREKVFLIQYMKVLCDCSDLKTPLVAQELMKTLSDEEKLSKEFWYIFQRLDLSPRGSLASQFFYANLKKFDDIAGKEEAYRRAYLGYSYPLQQILSGKQENETIKDLDAMSHEVAALKLENSEAIQSYILIAKAMTTNNIDKILTACEKRYAKIPEGQFPKNMFKQYEPKATAAQIARWEKLIQKKSSIK